ncbi:NADH:ubiquinone oxidoreductase subunit K [Candidatus Kinetoplastibacterium crithidii TCC036E]|uniref:NADH-quinone oxidoreductase subunit K n=2 Tax=Candidatus Kinetoplastidibacterium crithidiae TaxID=33056 RepID=M1M6S9_9PROT|nr:NADH-quinone oxidoreductase subunit K [Candidatus Kinetoplastibacterium crithidii (ex Angomonas deanei ATCC 30255)]AGF47775.1 NADH:ubiquinone oxidoreductase subunit K [Candidatus Kinetoplastibacterium crithidii TCC036E]
MLTLSYCLIVSSIIFSIGLVGIFINRKNLIVLLMSLELLLLSVNFNLVAFSRFNSDISGQVFVFFILTVAAAEAAIGLALLVLLFRNSGVVDSNAISNLRG